MYRGITGHAPEVILEAAKTDTFDTIQGAFSYIEQDERITRLIQYCY
jgi:hypothetical protein